MVLPRFLQFHTLHSYPAALLNRDDSGLAKRMPYGGTVRTRISSQCLKRHWRTADDEFSLRGIDGATVGIRSRNIVDRMVIQPLRVSGEYREDVLASVEEAFNRGVYGVNASNLKGRQPLLLGLPEVEHLRQRAEAICELHPGDSVSAGDAAEALFSVKRGEGRNFRGMLESARIPAGLEGALFGRMVTSDPGANIEAAIHVAHSFTVHEEESESDYFAVVDDLEGEDETGGAAHIGDTELTAGLFYGYVVVDVPGLVSNLEGCETSEWETADRSLASRVVEHLTHLMATVSPGARLGSTAPYSYAEVMLAEAGSRQPRSLGNAFRRAVAAQTEDAGLALARHLERLDSAYGVREARRLMSVDSLELSTARQVNLNELADWASEAVLRAEVN